MISDAVSDLLLSAEAHLGEHRRSLEESGQRPLLDEAIALLRRSVRDLQDRHQRRRRDLILEDVMLALVRMHAVGMFAEQHVKKPKDRRRRRGHQKPAKGKGVESQCDCGARRLGQDPIE